MIVQVNASRKYDVLIENGLIDSVGKKISEIHPSCRILLVSDDTVFALYGKRLTESLKKSGFSVDKFVFPHGEGSKSTRNLIEIVELAARLGLTRGDAFAALGGGVTGDLCGFAAATYMRGVEFFNFPTTFLSAVDSSVGGKTAVDLEGGKNLMGAFHQPSRVICDTELFRTLERETFADGAAEAIKTGLIRSAGLFNALCGDFSNDITGVVGECVRIKRDIVEADEFDRGERALLNFGHTVGHAIEKLSNFEVTHGHAVAIGMATITDAAERRGMCENGTAESLKKALEQNSLSYECRYSPDELALAACNDKKKLGNKLSLILPERIGKAYIYELDANKFADFLG